ncbi:MAG: 1-acyl-sn-glycerol-3-phosphate acyltransferase [Desulfobacterota bacterium]|nr:1-acyl-sn-glycerol-3-phosphate acyltransferase [Thermodesulfobacteriota bacterium]MDW8001126.1 lysophospholipid acyltransferase family protein [Deltaproteobacteria bacterium]
MRRAFCLLCLVISTIVLSIVAFFVFLFDRRGYVLHGIERLWAKIYLFSAKIDVFLEGEENLRNGPYVFMCNHQSALDIFVLLAKIPLSFRFVAKKELFRIPFMGWAMKCVGHISIDRESLRESKKALDEVVSKVKRGVSVLIFPEGTRSEDGNLLPFKKGAFHIVHRIDAQIVPCAIYGTFLLQPKGKFLPIKSGSVWVEIGKPIEIKDSGLKKSAVAEMVWKDIDRLLTKNKIKTQNVV